MSKLWLPPTAANLPKGHRHQVGPEDHERLQAGHAARCKDCGLRFMVKGQTVVNLPG